ncbi:protein Dok-7-like isoform X4 [Takifugu rubripes]|uniref:protein Dok-7-like isoform X4 n=1 Tax=Takifugu rubripes TaxID=31033 RepID=UPI0011454A63|nr:protein Dok-7-like isoform X4 [Takifugu rubripes]
MTDTVVAEGQVKFRDGKKWKTRWVVLRKPSPVADCLSLLVYKEKKKGKDKGSGRKERLNVTLEGICGVEPGLGYDGVSYSLSILCLAHTLVLGFSSRDVLLAWDARVRYSLGEVHRFSVAVEPGTQLESGPASLHLCNNLLVLTRGVPPITVGHWKLSTLRRYGAVPSGFVFEGGTRCGYWAGVFFLSSSEGERISFLLDCIVRGVSPSRTPHGLRPALPDLGADPASAEERICQEASDLEKRLSMLSECSLASSTASTYSCSTSVAGDDQSSVSSSSSSQSDVSIAGRLPFWAEPSARPHLSNETASSSSTLKALAGPDNRLQPTALGSLGARPSSGQLHPRGLNDSGRQSSLDSGIGIVAGSQSSYSGSFSSYTGSLDTSSQGGSEEYCSVASLLTSSPPYVPPPSPPPSIQSVPNLEHRSSAASPCPCTPTSSFSWSQRHGDERQTPSVLRLLGYDSPRSTLQISSLREPSRKQGPPELCRDSRSSQDGGQKSSSGSQRCSSRGSDRAPSVGSAERCSLRLLLQHRDAAEETQRAPAPENYITPEQWRTARDTCLVRVASSPPGPSPVPVQEEHEGVEDICDKLAGLTRCPLPPAAPPPPPPPTPPPPPPASPTSTGGVSQSSSLRGNSTAHYVNVPFSRPPAKTDRDPNEPGSAPVPGSNRTHRADGSSISYAHPITAMATAQRVGAEHVPGRESRPSQPGSRGRGPPR